MEENFNHTANCSMADWNFCYTKNVLIDYWGLDDYVDNEFKIFFSSIHRVLQVNHSDFEYQHVVGDLTYLKPSSSFQRFQSHTQIAIPVVFEYWSVQETDNMPRWFIVDERDQSKAIIENTNTEVLRNFVLPYASTMKTESDANVPMTNATNRFSLNEETVLYGVPFSTDRIIPTPLKTFVQEDAKSFSITGFTLSNVELLDHLWDGAADLLQKLGLNGMGDYKVLFAQGPLSSELDGSDSYIMEIAERGTFITGSDAQGLFHGLVSFIGLLDISNCSQMTLKEMTIHDKPRFEHRGHQVDVARNFRTKESIEKTIDAMSLWKLNFLHLSLTNDEGWRLEIPGLEELTSVGAKRCFDLTEETCLLTQLGSGPFADENQFYSRSEYIDLLQYAHARNVKIIPEFDMPAHARAAVMAMEARFKSKGDETYRLTDPDDATYLLTIQFYDRKSFINPCLDSSLRFVEKLVAEVKLMHDEAGVPLDNYHFGGDEVKNILLGAGYTSVAEDLKQQPFSKSLACQTKIIEDPTFDIEKIANYWAIKVNEILARNDVQTMYSWEDGLRGTTKDQYGTSSVAVNFWETLYWGGVDGLASIANDGFDVIMANPDYLYFDFPYEVHPEERGYYWGARFNSVYKVFTFAPENFAQNAETSRDRDGNEMSIMTPPSGTPNIRGMQGQTWSETIRTTDEYYEMVFPRMLAVAERAWHRASWELDWHPSAMYNLTTGLVPKDKLAEDYNGFISTLGCKELLKIRKLGISYRVPPPGARVDESGILSANSELPCIVILYSTDECKTWTTYNTPVEITSGLSGNKSVSLRSESADGALKSRVVVINMPSQLSLPIQTESGVIIDDYWAVPTSSASLRLCSMASFLLLLVLGM